MRAPSRSEAGLMRLMHCERQSMAVATWVKVDVMRIAKQGRSRSGEVNAMIATKQGRSSWLKVKELRSE
ncbi:hypothetical protein NDU88_003041 [Pleurodeles waltl]|uniref:Uncharacterized protein n=1 Tax=Pleurodeles waltl TaxID=8319 RepID=A0AAV7PBI1_PLEWA|nr:hypothetical protein NDU88_003041 [Pleurodeles waltl]